MSFLQPMNFNSAFRSGGQGNRSQLCRGNDAKCCRQCGQCCCTCGKHDYMVWDDSAFDNYGNQRYDNDCGCKMQNCDCNDGCDNRNNSRGNDCDRDCGCQREQKACNRCGERDQDCGCQREQKGRNRSDDCDQDWDGKGRGRDNDCNDDCDQDYSRRRNRRSGKDDDDCEKTTGMVYHVDQSMEKLFCAEQALQAGTMFPELYKPMNCADDPKTNCPSKQQEKAFTLWELRLYLNTHPCDKQVLRLYRQLAKEMNCPNYASTFDEDDCDCEKWNWVSHPWPWECNFRKGGYGEGKR